MTGSRPAAASPKASSKPAKKATKRARKRPSPATPPAATKTATAPAEATTNLSIEEVEVEVVPKPDAAGPTHAAPIPEPPPGPPREVSGTPELPEPHPLLAEDLKEFERIAEESFEVERDARHDEAQPLPADRFIPHVSAREFLREGVGTMSVVMVTPELSPVAKIGGLADVVFGLSRELEIRGNSVEIILPKYDRLRHQHIWGLTPVMEDLWVPWYGGAVHCTVFFGFVHGRKCFFIEPHSADRFFERGKVYGDNDDVLRFAFFSRAAIEFLYKSGKRPDIVHCHDWQTGLVPVFLFEIYQHLGMRHTRACYTIHNFKHQGVCGEYVLNATGLNRPEYYFHHDRLGWIYKGSLNLMKGGIVYSNFVNTVSPTHAGEARNRGCGFGLEPVLQAHHEKYGGILNGIDYEVWNPEIDGHIPVQYSAESIQGKYDNKRALRQRLLLSDNAKPIIAFIGRLDPQKGLDLVRHAIFFCVNHGAQFVLLGSGAEPGIDDHFLRLKGEINENPDSHLEIGFSEELAHLIYAGADMMVVPSRFEPCGLTQLISMRYGTVPIVRSVGGLADTVFDKDFSQRPLHERNGYVFHHDDHLGLESALSRAIACYYTYPDHFRHLMQNAMRSDYSWNVPGQHYLNVYDHIRAK